MILRTVLPVFLPFESEHLPVKLDQINAYLGALVKAAIDPDALKVALDTLARFELPIRVTEFNFPGQRSRFARNRRIRLTPEEEKAKAEAIVDY